MRLSVEQEDKSARLEEVDFCFSAQISAELKANMKIPIISPTIQSLYVAQAASTNQIPITEQAVEPNTQYGGIYAKSDYRFSCSLFREESDKRYKRYFKGFISALSVLLLHILAIIILNLLWTRSVPIVQQASVTKIQSYLYQAPNKEPELALLLDLDSSSVSAALAENLAQKSTLNQPQADHFEPKVTNIINSKAGSALNEQMKPLKPAIIVSSKPQMSAESGHERLDSAINNQLAQSSVQMFTQSYLARQRETHLDEQILNTAEQYTQKRSLSEMDGTMQELIFVEEDEYSKIITTQHRLDPNRVLKQGNDCYRIVKNGNQINPYAENPGYWFNCGEDKTKKAINEAIDKRLEQRMISR
ncbi:hypothetical protein [uncultured Shewanella sp.]|uniref:hypothetical protein n=1 Tax=uncultured Shewanella sp. TaxID=173975 RepID=UPI002624DE4D|nr:hypothetical protein [uncultured Shewanella sp.]